jgi:hypothetical protein
MRAQMREDAKVAAPSSAKNSVIRAGAIPSSFSRAMTKVM